MLCCLLFLLVVTADNAQSSPGESTPLSPALQSMVFKLGEWRWEARGLTGPGDSALHDGVGYSRVYPVNDGHALIDDHRIEWDNGVVYRAITYRTVDPASGDLMVVWAQADSGSTLKIDASWADGRYREINRGEDGFGRWTNTLTIDDIGADSHSARLIRRYESGLEIPSLQYRATRMQ